MTVRQMIEDLSKLDQDLEVDMDWDVRWQDVRGKLLKSWERGPWKEYRSLYPTWRSEVDSHFPEYDPRKHMACSAGYTFWVYERKKRQALVCPHCQEDL